MYGPIYGFMYGFVYGVCTVHRATYGATYGFKNAQRTIVFGEAGFRPKIFFWDVCVDKPTDFKSPPMHRNVRLVEENARECSYTTPDGIPRGRISAGLAVGGVEPDGVLGL